MVTSSCKLAMAFPIAAALGNQIKASVTIISAQEPPKPTKVYPPMNDSLPPRIPASNGTQPPQTPELSWRAGWLVICGILFALFALFVHDHVSDGYSYWVALPLAAIKAVAIFIGFALVGSLFTADGRKSLRVLGRHLPESIRCYIVLMLRRSEKRDLAHAIRATGGAGQIFRRAHTLIWCETTLPLENEIFAQLTCTAGAFAALTGQSAGVEHKLRCLVFEKRASFDRYNRKLFRSDVKFVGYYSGVAGSRIILDREWANLFPADWRNILAHEYAHFLDHRCLSKNRERWLEEGLAQHLAKQSGPPPLHAPGSLARALRTWRMRGLLFSGADLISLDALALEELARDWRSELSATRHWAFYLQSAGLFQWLRDNHPGKLLARLRSQGDRNTCPVKNFQAGFGLSPDEAMQQWLATLSLEVPAPPDIPSSNVRNQIDHKLLPLLAAKDADSDDRRLAIRYLAFGGYMWRADRLIAIAENSQDPLRQEAWHALECLAGQLGSTIPGGWNQWFTAQPAAATGAD
jgi:hypothetical protein